MALPFEPVGEGPNQHNWDFLSRRFPLGPQDLQNFVLKLAVTGTARKVAFGSATLTWPGGSPFTNTLTQAHGLGVTPVIAIGTAQLSAGSDPCLVSWVAVDGTNVQWRGHDTAGLSPALNTTKTFHWLAIA